MRVLDGHTHAFPDHVAPGAIKALSGEARWRTVTAHHDGSVGGLLASMDRAGVERCILCSVATRPAQVPKITDWSAAVASGRVIPFASVHPDYPMVEAEIERMATLGIRGVKFHPQYMQCAVDDPRMLRIARAAAKAGLAMALHAGHDLAFEKDDLASPAKIRGLHDAVPDLRLLACHLGGWEQWEQVVECIVGRPIWLETSFTIGQCPPALMEKILSRHPAEYLMFGSDSPWADQCEELAAFQRLGLSAPATQAALWDNGHRFMGMPAR